MTTTPISSQVLEWIRASVPEELEIPVATKELERRWTAVKKAMEDHRIDVLVAYGDGYARWFTDGAAVATVFPRDDEMTVTGQGPFGTDVKSPPGRRGVKRYLAAPPGGTAPFARHYDAELVEKALEPYASGTIGLVGPTTHAMVEYFENRLTKATFVDASEMVDAIKVLKSDQEWELIRRSAAMHDEAMEAALAAIKPGLRNCEVAAVAEYVVRRYGINNGLYMYNSAPIGTPAPLIGGNKTRVLQKGDVFILLVECPGPGGMYTELGRTAVLGKASQQMKEELEFAMRAQKFTLDLLKPGALCKEIWAAYNQFMRENDRPEERRLHCHGQGYDLVERPIIRMDESMRIEQSMNIAVHPMYLRNGYYSWLCDNFHIGEHGVTERIHKIPQKIFELE